MRTAGSHKVGIFGRSARSDAEREPGFRKNDCVSGELLLGTFRAGFALFVAKMVLPETQ